MGEEPLRLLGLDLETTGLDPQKDRILKLGMILVDTESEVPLFEKEWTLWHDTYPEITASAFETHKIQKKHCIEFGRSPIGFFTELSFFLEPKKIDYLVAHNGNHFDFPMLLANVDAFNGGARSFFDKLKKMDTATDIPYPESIQTRKLIHLAAEHGFLNPFPHSTLSDIRTMLEILKKYPIEKVCERAASETVLVQAKVVFETREQAKARRFYWDTPTQRWLKKIKMCDLSEEIDKAEFEIILITK